MAVSENVIPIPELHELRQVFMIFRRCIDLCLEEALLLFLNMFTENINTHASFMIYNMSKETDPPEWCHSQRMEIINTHREKLEVFIQFT